MISTKTKLEGSLKAQTLFGELSELADVMGRNVPVSYVLAFLRVAAAGSAGIDQGRLMDDVKTNPATMSRVARILGRMSYDKQSPGLGLAEVALDPLDNRKRTLRPLARGSELMAKIAKGV